MGEAKRKKDEHNRWLASLDAEGREIANTALLAHKRIVEEKGLTGGCYLLAFFLTRYLKEEHGISVRPVVGWVNDGTTLLMASHAWIESEGKITDISLTRTEHPDVQLPGPLTILGHVVYDGYAKYTYHATPSQGAIDALHELATELPDIVRMKEMEHSQMLKISADNVLMKQYLDGAPADRRYVDLAHYLSK